MPPEPGLEGSTIRQVLQPKLAGTQVRVVLSNEYGNRPLTVTGATIAQSEEASRIDLDSLVTLTFDGRPGVTIQPGTFVYSDAAEFPVDSFSNLALTTHTSAVPEELTGHPGSRTTSYILEGSHLEVSAMPDAVRTDHWYLVSSIEVTACPKASAMVVIGDSITDGRGSITNQNNRWPDVLARRLSHHPELNPISVLNQGVGGGRMLRDGLGISALGRLDRDVLAQPRVRWLVLFIGVNDIGTVQGSSAPGQETTIAEDLISGYRQIIHRARNHGIRVIGCTIMPFYGHGYYTPEREVQRQQLNAWIRTSPLLDGVIDFDQIGRDPEDPMRLSAAVDGGDHLHPSAEGYRRMAEAIDLSLFSQ